MHSSSRVRDRLCSNRIGPGNRDRTCSTWLSMLAVLSEGLAAYRDAQQCQLVDEAGTNPGSASPCDYARCSQCRTYRDENTLLRSEASPSRGLPDLGFDRITRPFFARSRRRTFIRLPTRRPAGKPLPTPSTGTGVDPPSPVSRKRAFPSRPEKKNGFPFR